MAGAINQSGVEILLSTMNRDSLDFLKPMFPFGDFSDFHILIINQTTERKMLASPYNNVRVINSLEKGLAKSRNLALKYAEGAFGLIADDDVVFQPGFINEITDACHVLPKNGIWVFRATDSNGNLYKKYPDGTVKGLSQLQQLSVMSIEMVVNIAAIKKQNISFDERFGLGSTFIMGEEAIFVKAVHNAGLQVSAIPRVIVSHPVQDTHNRITVADKYYIQGAFFSVLFSKKWLGWLLLKIAFELKNKKISFSDISTALKAAYKGRKALHNL